MLYDSVLISNQAHSDTAIASKEKLADAILN